MILSAYQSCIDCQQKDPQTKLQKTLKNEVMNLKEFMTFAPSAVIILCGSSLQVWSEHDGM